MATAPISAPQKKNNLVWWILGVIGGGLILLVASVLLVAGFFAKNVHVSEKDKQVEINTPAGQATLASTDSVREIGLPVYPGSTLVESGGSVEVTTSRSDTVGFAAVHYRTTDSTERVDEWYRNRLGPDFKRKHPDPSDPQVHVQGVSLSSSDVAFISERDGLLRIVTLRSTLRGVEIGLVRIGKRETQ